jgi:hypothetical protein
MDPVKAAAWLKIFEDPRFKQCLENARRTREKIAEEVFKRHYDIEQK